MSIKIKHLRSDIEGRKPNAENLDYGVLAMNYVANKEQLFIKNTSDIVTSFSSDNILNSNFAGRKTADGGEIFNDYVNNKAKLMAHAEGSGTTASGESSHAEGFGTFASGASSHSEGQKTKANGIYSHAEGQETEANGQSSHVEGHLSKSNKDYSHAEGSNTKTEGESSHSEGSGTTTYGIYSHAEGVGDPVLDDVTFEVTNVNGNTFTFTNNVDFGYGKIIVYNNIAYRINSGTKEEKKFTLDKPVPFNIGSVKVKKVKNGVSYGEGSHSEGGYTVASGRFSHAEGNDTMSFGEDSHTEGYFSRAKGAFSHAEGWHGKAWGESSHSEGNDTYADGKASHAEGNKTKTTSNFSHAEGDESQAIGLTSHAEGVKVKAIGEVSHIEGKADYVESEYIHNANITASNAESKTFTINNKLPAKFKIGSVINIDEIYYKLINISEDRLTCTLDKPLSNSVGNGKQIKRVFGLSYGNTSHSEGLNSVSAGESSHAEGQKTTSSGNHSHAEGDETLAFGESSHAEGINTYTEGLASHAEGSLTQSNGNSSHAEGGMTMAIGDYSHAEGSYTTASGRTSHSEGNGTTASGECSHSEGNGTKANGNYSHAEGNKTFSNGLHSHSEGCETSATTNESHSEGWATKASGTQSHAEGQKTTASGNEGSHAEGKNTLASGSEGSHAEGRGTRATGPRAHAEGLETSAITDDTHSEGKWTTAKGDGSHAEGNHSIASGSASHAEGQYTVAGGNEGSHAEGKGTIATGPRAHAEGLETSAITDDTHSEGKRTLAKGDGSHAEGYETKANGVSSHAEGTSSITNGNSSHAEGKSITRGEYSHAEGKIDEFYRTVKKEVYEFTKTVTVEGGFTSAGSMTQPMYSINTYNLDVKGAVLHSDKISKQNVEYIIISTNGDYIVFDRYLEDTSGGDIKLYTLNTHTEQVLKEIGSIGVASHSEGNNSTAMGNYSHAEGYETKANGVSSHAEGGMTMATSDYSHAEGELMRAVGKGSHAEGHGDPATDSWDTEVSSISGKKFNFTSMVNVNGYTLDPDNIFYAESDPNTYYRITEMSSNYIIADKDIKFSVGKQKLIYGKLGISFGDYSHTEGASTLSCGFASHAEGDCGHAMGRASHAEGYYGYANGEYSHVEGDDTKANGKGSHAEGWKTVTDGDNSHAEGSNTKTTNSSEHAEGKFNVSTPNKTISSIGIGTDNENRKNAFEVTNDGKVYILGVNEYDGTNLDTAKSIQDTLNTDVSVLISNGKNIYYWEPECFYTTENLPDEMKGDKCKCKVYTAKVKFTSTGDYTFTFNYITGTHKLNIKGVDIINPKNDVLVKDYHNGKAGKPSNLNSYTLKGVNQKEYVILRYFVNEVDNESGAADDINSYGYIEINKSLETEQNEFIKYYKNDAGDFTVKYLHCYEHKLVKVIDNIDNQKAYRFAATSEIAGNTDISRIVYNNGKYTCYIDNSFDSSSHLASQTLTEGTKTYIRNVSGVTGDKANTNAYPWEITRPHKMKLSGSKLTLTDYNNSEIGSVDLTNGNGTGSTIATTTGLDSVYKRKISKVTLNGNGPHSLKPNTLYIINGCTNGSITLSNQDANYLDEYMIELRNCTKVAFPSSISWARQFPTDISKTCKYNISIVNGLGLWCEF